MTDIKTYGMSERADNLDFDIRSQLVRPPLVKPHRHEYFQIQISLQGDTEQTVAGTVRPFKRGYLSFILPYRVHVVLHPEGSRYVIINMAQEFLRPGLDVDPLDLEGVPMSRAPELAPFLFQEFADFYFTEAEFPEIEALLERLALENANGPSLLALTRQNLLAQPRPASGNLSANGAYRLRFGGAHGV